EPFSCRDTTGACTGDPDSEMQLSEDAAGYALSYPAGVSEHYDTAGRLVSETDPRGRITTYGYTSGKLTSVTGPFGHTLTFAWNGGHIASVTDPAGEIYAYTYDAKHNLTRVDYPDGDRK